MNSTMGLKGKFKMKRARGTLEQADKVAREYVSSGLSPRLIQQFPTPPAIFWSRGNSDDVPRLEVEFFLDRCGVIVQSLD